MSLAGPLSQSKKNVLLLLTFYTTIMQTIIASVELIIGFNAQPSNPVESISAGKTQTYRYTFSWTVAVTVGHNGDRWESFRPDHGMIRCGDWYHLRNSPNTVKTIPSVYNVNTWKWLVARHVLFLKVWCLSLCYVPLVGLMKEFYIFSKPNINNHCICL